jgi:hypothetical protein
VEKIYTVGWGGEGGFSHPSTVSSGHPKSQSTPSHLPGCRKIPYYLILISGCLKKKGGDLEAADTPHTHMRRNEDISLVEKMVGLRIYH